MKSDQIVVLAVPSNWNSDLVGRIDGEKVLLPSCFGFFSGRYYFAYLINRVVGAREFT